VPVPRNEVLICAAVMPAVSFAPEMTSVCDGLSPCSGMVMSIWPLFLIVLQRIGVQRRLDDALDHAGRHRAGRHAVILIGVPWMRM
jgi:hypothetical protein